MFTDDQAVRLVGAALAALMLYALLAPGDMEARFIRLIAGFLPL